MDRQTDGSQHCLMPPPHRRQEDIISCYSKGSNSPYRHPAQIVQSHSPGGAYKYLKPISGLIWPTQVYITNGISVGLAVFAGLWLCPTNRHILRDHATCEIGSISPQIRKKLKTKTNMYTSARKPSLKVASTTLGIFSIL